MHGNHRGYAVHILILVTAVLLLSSVAVAQNTATPAPISTPIAVETTPDLEGGAFLAELTQEPAEATAEATAESTLPSPISTAATAPVPQITGTPEPAAPEVTSEATVQVTEAPLSLSTNAVCSDLGVIVNLTNDGEAMAAPLEYTLDGIASGSIQLGAGEQIAINAGYGQPVFQIAALAVTVDEPCLAPGTLSGQVWDDTNASGAVDSAELGLAAVTVRALRSDGMTTNTLTDTTGHYSFEALTAGTYTVSVLPESLPAAFAATFDVDGTLDGQTEIVISNGVNSSADFGYREQIPSILGGYVWLDANRNSAFDSGESGVSGIGISLQNAVGEAAPALTTDSTGHFSFDGIFEGHYTVAINAGSIPANAVLATSSAVSFDVVMGQSREDLRFGLQPPAAASSISGSVLEQFASDTVFTISLYNAAGSLVASAQTGAGGSFGFGQLAAGQYIVRLNTDALPANVYLPVDDTDGGTDAAIMVTLDGANAISGLYFNLLISA
ncbi:MAG: carboxypeptidase regulatory-like domain-containing protein [Anaerolineae bacterium]|nr:carboxypeptidase regulatory-like domain-containing protein [Anaerolineae bacterium]